tara:strand:+ start:711 stop:1181 length:471 start_codon:yes stop_codon:yes gene_type:complete
MAIQLKKVSNLETLALGFNYEGEINIKDDVPTGGAVDIQFNSAELVGTVGKVGLVVDQHVPADNSGSTDYTSYKVVVGDTADPDGQIDDVELCPAGTEAAIGTIFVNTGDDPFGTVVSNVGATFTSLNETDEALATAGKVRLFFEYYPTAGDNFSG